MKQSGVIQKHSNKENKKIIVLISIILGLLLLSLFYSYKDYVKPAAAMNVVEQEVPINSGDKMTMNPGSILEQKVKLDVDTISSISLAFALENVDDTKVETIVEFIESDSGKVLEQWIVSEEELAKSGFTSFDFPELLTVERGGHYTIKIVNKANSNLYLSGMDREDVKLYADGEEQNAILAYRVVGGSSRIPIFFYCIIAAILILMVVLIAVLLIKIKKIEKIFIPICIVLGMIYMFLIPPYFSPDEAAHFSTVYARSSQLLGEDVYDEDGNVLVRKEDMDYYEYIDNVGHWPLNRKCYIKTIKGFFEETTKADLEEKASFRSDLKAVSTLAYFPQIIGISIARILGMNAVQLLVLGRLMALIFYCVCMYFAIKLIPFAKMIPFSVGLLPITIQQVVSYNYDSVLFATAFLVISYMLYLAYTKEKVEKKDVILLLVLAVLMSPIKMIYSLLFGMGLLIPYQKFGNGKNKIISAALIVCVAITAIIAVQTSTLVGMADSSAARVTFSGEPLYTLNYVIHDPVATFGVFFRTFERMTDFYFKSGIALMGWLEIGVPTIYLVGFSVVLLLSTVKVTNEKEEISSVGKLLLGAIVVLVSLAVYLSLLLAWTKLSANMVDGIQGRYFLPILPLILLLCRNKVLTVSKNIDKYLVCILIFLQVNTVLQIFTSAIVR